MRGDVFHVIFSIISKRWLTLGRWWQSSGQPRGATSQIWSRRHKHARWPGNEGWPARATPPAQRSALLRCGSAYRAWCHNLTFNRGNNERRATGWLSAKYQERLAWMIINLKIRLSWLEAIMTPALAACTTMSLWNPNKAHWHIRWSKKNKRKKTQTHPEA